MPYIGNDDLKMYYEDIGVGDPIIFIHGSLSRGIIGFASQIQAFQFLYRSIYPDLRGHGATSAKDIHWTTPQLADDIIFLMNQLNIPKAHIIGHSMGGDIAMYCATKYPSRVLSLISISSTGFINEEVKKYVGRYHPQKIDREKYHILIESLKKDHYPAHKGNWEALLNETNINCERYPDFTDADLQKITMPFLLIYGDKDTLVKNEEIKTLTKNIRLFVAQRIEETGHFPHIVGHKCEEINRTILNFIKQSKDIK